MTLNEDRQAENAVGRPDSVIDFKKVLNLTPDASLLVNVTSAIVFSNQAAVNLFGYEAEELSKKQLMQLFHEDNWEELSLIFGFAFSKNNGHLINSNYKLDIISKSGNQIPIDLLVSIISDELILLTLHPQTVGLASTSNSRNILNRLSEVTDIAVLGTWEMDLLNNKITWDDNMYKLLGISPTDYPNPGMAWSACQHPDDKQKYDQEIRKVLLSKDTEFSLDFKTIRPDKSIRYIIAKGIIERDEMGAPIRLVGMDWDITEQKKVAEEAQHLSDFQKVILDSTKYAIFTESTDGVLTSMNKGAEEMLGYKAEELVGIHSPSIFHDIEQFDQRVKEYAEKYNVNLKPGLETLTFEYENGLDQIKDWTFIRKDGTRIKVNLTVCEMKNPDGTSRGQLAVAKDITKQIKNAQKLRRYAERLENKNKELEQFTYIASHDLQEPLRTISNFCGLLNKSEALKQDNLTQKYLDFMNSATRRMQNLIKCLLDYSRLGKEMNYELVDTNLLLDEVKEDLRSAIADNKATISFDHLPQVNGLKTELRLLFQNLISNAIKFKRPDQAPHIQITASPQNEAWEFCVKDNGIGIDSTYHKKIFQIFQQLNSDSRFDGHGIGLSHCKKIIEHHGGKIWVESELKKGSQFYFTIANTKNN